MDKKLIEECKLEDQFILRLPTEEARFVHGLLASDKPKKIAKHLKIELNEDTREGTVYVKKKAIPAKLVDLPTIIESSKSVNKVTTYKTANIYHMLICADGTKNLEDIKVKYSHGLTPPMKNVAKTRFRKTLTNKEDILLNDSGDLQKELKVLLKADCEAISTRFEIVYFEDANNNDEEITEKSLFGEVSSDSESSNYDIIEFS